MDFPIHLAPQLKQHLRALRKERGLTQAALGRLLGVGQARIAEIESNPGVVSVEQLMRVLAAMDALLVLRAGGAEPPRKAKASTAPAERAERAERKKAVPQPESNRVIRAKKGSW
ncbi:Helix-turn-helix domain-containing protein [Burkholderiales bacterium 8X]|nr:Helix-turn-helix domain-containing protein [Burkholderiales bacterium 8X]